MPPETQPIANILLTGASGFVGHVTRDVLVERGHSVVGVARTGADVALDLLAPDALDRRWAVTRPDAVIHLAAVPDIVPCREDPEGAWRLNAEVPGALALRCAAEELRLVHVSTDQVFDGTRGDWREDDPAQPIHHYGVTKLAGEQAVLQHDPAAVIVRPGLVTGLAPEGRRSSTTGLLAALRRAVRGEGEAPRMFTDEIRSPVAVVDLARVLAELVERPDLVGVFHCGGPEALSRCELGLREARAHGFDQALVGTGTRAEAGLAAERPADLSLDSTRLVTWLGWQPRATAEG